MSDEPRDPPVRDLTPEDVARGLAEDRMLLVDVREPNETAVERYPGAVIVPLSTFDPARFPIRRAARWCSPAAPAAARSPPRRRRRRRAFPTTRIWPAASWPGRRPGLPTET